VATASISSLGDQTLSQADLLKLLVTQLQNQDPLEPVKDTDFIGQMAQFSTLQGVETLNTSFDQTLKLQQLTGGSDLIGKTVSYGNNSSGKVTGLTVQGGSVQLQIGSNSIALDNVTGVLPT
jgi:flagellar basal-body rod modification protein FlgD